MENINKIIKEEINRFIINENINTLSQYSSNLNNALNEMGREMARNNINVNTFNNDLKQYFKSFEIYVIQIINAINRCVQSNSLNEGLGSWGINIPPELGGNFWNDAKRGYYATKNFLTRGRGGYSSNAIGTRMVNNPNSVPSVKLSALLGNLRTHQNNFNIKNTQYNIDNRMTRQPREILFNILPQLNSTYGSLVRTMQQQQNAQGTNP